jgi:flagellar hook assembly protein FlgD
VSLTVYNILGQKVKRIDAGYKKAGFYTEKDKALFWNLRNDRGERVSKGLYFVRFTAGKFSATSPMAVRY